MASSKFSRILQCVNGIIRRKKETSAEKPILSFLHFITSGRWVHKSFENQKPIIRNFKTLKSLKGPAVRRPPHHEQAVSTAFLLRKIANQEKMGKLSLDLDERHTAKK